MPTPSSRRFADEPRQRLPHHKRRGQPPPRGSPTMDMEEERNPFTLPSDEEVFKMRDEEKRRKKSGRYF